MGARINTRKDSDSCEQLGLAAVEGRVDTETRQLFGARVFRGFSLLMNMLGSGALCTKVVPCLTPELVRNAASEAPPQKSWPGICILARPRLMQGT